MMSSNSFASSGAKACAVIEFAASTMFEIAIFLALRVAKYWNFQYCDLQQMQDWD